MPAFHPLQAALHPKTVSHRERSYGGVRCREAETVTGEQRTLARSSDLSIGTIVPSETPRLQHRELCDQNTKIIAQQSLSVSVVSIQNVFVVGESLQRALRQVHNETHLSSLTILLT